MSKFVTKIEHVPTVPELNTDANILLSILRDAVAAEILLWDYYYYYTNHEGWGKVFADVLLKMPEYTTAKFDCENFALLTMARVLERYKLNSCGIAIGDSPLGRHGWNIFVSDVGLFYLEPQTGDIFSVTENSGYKADLIIMG